MTFFAFLLFSPILLIGVDGHGALVWPPNWTDGQPIPLDQRLNTPNCYCSLKFWALSSMHRCPFNCFSIFKGCFHNFASHTRWNKSIVGPYKDAGTGWGYNYPYSMSTDQVENIEALADIFEKLNHFVRLTLAVTAMNTRALGRWITNRISKNKGWDGAAFKSRFLYLSPTL